MAYDPTLHHRRSVRLQDFNYGQDGAYFLTVCTHNRASLFGALRTIADVPTAVLNDAGTIVRDCWIEIPRHFPFVTLDAFVVMPDHVHGILMLQGHDLLPGWGRGANDYSPLHGGTSETVGSIVRGFKIGVTKWFKRNRPGTEKIWQRSYYEHVIRNELELHSARQYIVENPVRKLCRGE